MPSSSGCRYIASFRVASEGLKSGARRQKSARRRPRSAIR